MKIGGNNKGILIGLVLTVVVLMGGTGYLIWRVNQKDTLAPTDSDASSTSCYCPYDKCKQGTADCSNHESGRDGCIGCSMEGYYCYIGDAICTTSYVITYVAGTGGSVTKAGPNSVVSGGSISSTATPNAGYRFVKWSDDKTTALRTDSNVSADATYTATFEVLPAEKVTLTYIAGSGGTITGTTTQTIDKGASGTEVTAVPNAGYKFVRWSDGKTTATRTDTNVQASATYTATFEAFPTDKVTLTYIAGSGGTITGTTTQTIDKGASGTEVTAVPNAGYKFVRWSDGKTTATRTDTNVQASATYTATFKSANVVPQTGIFDDTGNTIALGVVFLMMGLEWTWVSTLPMKAYNAISFTTSKIKEDRESKRVQRRRNRLERRIK